MQSDDKRITAEQCYALWRSGFVNRWHTHPDPRLRNSQDLTGGHSWRVQVLVVALATNSENIHREGLLTEVLTALFHDAPEVFTGDASSPFKKTYPEVRALLNKAGMAWCMDNNVPAFPENERVKLCDQLDAYLYMLHNAPDLQNLNPWKKMLNGIIGLARDLHVAGYVGDVVHFAKERKDWF